MWINTAENRNNDPFNGITELRRIHVFREEEIKNTVFPIWLFLYLQLMLYSVGVDLGLYLYDFCTCLCLKCCVIARKEGWLRNNFELFYFLTQDGVSHSFLDTVRLVLEYLLLWVVFMCKFYFIISITAF